MKFELNPTMVLTAEEFVTLDKALKLCRDMDVATSCGDDYDDRPHGCYICPKQANCTQMANECVFVVAHNALKEIIDMSVIE